MAYTESQRAWIWLSSVKGLGRQRFLDLLSHFGCAQAVWENPKEAAALLGPKTGRALLEARTDECMEALLRTMEKSGITAITQLDAEYPVLLGEIANAPLTLYVRGRLTLVETRSVAIVGTRVSSPYGTRMARRIARELAETGVTIVSGFARGIDTAAHQGAVEAGGRTVAVFGSGADVVYPAENLTLCNELLACGGSVVSANPPGTIAYPSVFPARNRIISGLSEGTVVVEATRGSGALMTADYALAQGRALFAVPGQADSPASAGTHDLIRKNGARLVTCAADVARDLGWQIGASAAQTAPRVAKTLPLLPDEQRLYNLLSSGPVDVDELPALTGMTMAEVNPLLTTLEIQGIIEQTPGRKVARADLS